MPTQTTQKNTRKEPELRFPEFLGCWEEKKLGEVATFSKGKGISKNDITENGKNKCIRYGELYTTYDEIIEDIKSKTNTEKKNSALSSVNDLIIPSSGEINIDIATVSCVKEKNIILGGDLNIIRLKEDNDGEFFAYYLSNYKKREIAKFGQGHSVVHLYSSHFKDLKLRIPQKEEQQKIAGFLGGVDEWVENLKEQKEELEKYKKGMMQKIFSQEVRFKDENGKNFPDWEEKKLGEVLAYEQPTNYIVESTKYNDEHKTPVLTAGKTFVLGYIDEENNIFDARKNPVIIFDDFTTAKQFVNFKFKVKSSAMKILKNKNENISDIRFLFSVMQRIRFGLGEEHKRFWISEYSKIKILLPTITEQRKIADFLTSLDNLVESKQQQITQAEQWKKGLVQGLFV